MLLCFASFRRAGTAESRQPLLGCSQADMIPCWGPRHSPPVGAQTPAFAASPWEHLPATRTSRSFHSAQRGPGGQRGCEVTPPPVPSPLRPWSRDRSWPRAGTSFGSLERSLPVGLRTAAGFPHQLSAHKRLCPRVRGGAPRGAALPASAERGTRPAEGLPCSQCTVGPGRPRGAA